MRLKQATITHFKSISDSTPVTIDPQVTVLVGQNESGKTAFLQALHKARPAEGSGGYNETNDYPRTHLNDYEKRQEKEKDPDTVATLVYELTQAEIKAINDDLGFVVLNSLEFTLEHKYGNGSSYTMSIPEEGFVQHLLQTAPLSTENRSALKDTKTILKLIEEMEKLSLNSEEVTFKAGLEEKFKTPQPGWTFLLRRYIWTQHIQPRVPAFVYFDDYYLLPYKTSLKELAQKVQQAGGDRSKLKEEHQSVLGLLTVAGVDLKDLTNAEGYERIKAKLESISNGVSDTLFRYWRQNQNLEVQFDIRNDPTDSAPFDTGDNLYIRIRNTRHRATLPFDQRSKGFRWFFSFLVWFSSIKDQLQKKKDLILLLDEPGLSLHGLAQADLLRYIDDLSGNHQVIYTTHSPFMVNSDRLHQVRTVEDKEKEGTRVTDDITGANEHTLFPLQAALGYSMAQNLFISPRNLLVEGPGDLVYLRHFSALLEKAGREHLRSDVTVVPVGGLDKIATFIALLHGNDLEFAVLHDFDKRPDPRIDSLIKDKIIKSRQVLHYAMFRDPKKVQTTAPFDSTDVEDLISPTLYLKLFHAAYSKELGGASFTEAQLPPRERMVERINAHLQAQGIQLRQSGGFNHYLIANHMASTPSLTSKTDRATLDRFENLFRQINRLFD